jgi:hypothetical protein
MLLASGELSIYEAEKLSSIEPLLQSSYFTNCKEKGITPHLVLTPIKEKGGSQIISSPTPSPSTPLPVSPLAWSSRSPSSTASPAQRLNREESFSAPSPPTHLSPITSKLPFTLVRSASVSEEVSIPHNTNSVKMVLRQQAVKPNSQNPPSPTTSSSNLGSHISATSKKNAFSTVKITEKHRTHLQNIFSRPLAPKVADKEEVADFRNSLKDW